MSPPACTCGSAAGPGRGVGVFSDRLRNSEKKSAAGRLYGCNGYKDKELSIMIRKSTRYLSVLAAGAMALGIAHTPSQALTIMPSAGRATDAADYGCFWLSYSTMTNGCSSVKRLETSLPIGGSGWVNVKVNAQGASPSNNVGCEAIAVNDAVTSFWGYGVRWLPAFGSAQNIMTTTWVPGGGGLYVYCDVYPNGRVNTINY
jgi:hypothetical protein